MDDQGASENFLGTTSAGRGSADRHLVPVKTEERLHNNMLHSKTTPAGVIPDSQQADLVQVKACQDLCAVAGSVCHSAAMCPGDARCDWPLHIKRSCAAPQTRS